MSPAELEKLGGHSLKAEEVAALGQELLLTSEFIRLLTALPLAGLRFSIPDTADESGLGVEMQWLTAPEILSEATDVYPGILASKLGFVPVGMCLAGSGDPYFYRNADGAVVHIPHEAAVGGRLNETMIEVVAASVEDFLAASEIGPNS